MGQLLRILLILFGLWLVIQIIKRAFATPPDESLKAKPTIPKMVACTHCAIHIPESQAIRDGDRVYCCEEHRKLAQKS